LRKSGLPKAVPPVRHAVASEPTGVVAQAKIDVAKVSLAVVDAVRINHPVGSAGKIVVESLERLARVEAPGTKQKAQEFLVLAVDTNDRVRRILVLSSKAGDVVKLLVTLGVPFQRESFLSFAPPQVVAIEQLGNNRDADLEATFAEFGDDIST